MENICLQNISNTALKKHALSILYINKKSSRDYCLLEKKIKVGHLIPTHIFLCVCAYLMNMYFWKVAQDTPNGLSRRKPFG